jgi:hypothetical protein
MTPMRDRKILFFLVPVMKIQRIYAFIVTTSLAFSSFIFNGHEFYLPAAALNGFHKALPAAFSLAFRPFSQSMLNANSLHCGTLSLKP